MLEDVNDQQEPSLGLNEVKLIRTHSSSLDLKSVKSVDELPQECVNRSGSGETLGCSTESSSSSPDISSQIFRQHKVVEMGEIKSYKPMIFQITFERYPIWVLCLDKSFTKAIYFPDFESWHDLETALDTAGGELYFSCLVKLGQENLIFSSTSKVDTDIHLISGPLESSYTWDLPFDIPTVFLCEHQVRTRKRKWKSYPTHFTRINHSSVGGATNFVGSFYCSVDDSSPS